MTTQNTINEKTIDYDKRPWIVYLMSIWSFIGVTSMLSTFLRYISDGNSLFLQYGSIGLLIFGVFFLVFIFQMRRIFLVLFGGLSILLCKFQLVNVVGILISEAPFQTTIYIILTFAILSGSLGGLAIRPSFLKYADNFRALKLSKKSLNRDLKKLGL